MSNTQSQPKPVTFADIMTAAVRRAGVQGTETTGLYKVLWYGGPWDAQKTYTDFKHGEPNPLNPSMLIFRIFEDSEEVRVYCIQTEDPKEGEKAFPPSCYHLQKSARVYSAHSMSLTMFVNELAEELRQVTGFYDPDMVTCPKCDVEVPELVHCGACGELLPIDPDDDDDEEDEPEEPPSPTVSAGSVAAAPSSPNGTATP
jgi:hypothetical protein